MAKPETSFLLLDEKPVHWEKQNSEHSHWLRPGRFAKAAVQAQEKCGVLWSGYPARWLGVAHPLVGLSRASAIFKMEKYSKY